MSASRALRAIGCFCLAAALADASGARLPVPARIAIVDAERAPFTPELEVRFAERLDAARAATAGAQGASRLERVSAREAAARLKRGECDAILFVGADRPGTLRSLKASTLAALCGHVLAPTPVYLVVPNGDPDAKRVLREAFAAAVGDVPNRERVAALE